MPLADYECPACGAIVRDRYFTSAEGAISAAPFCLADDCAGSQRMSWIPQAAFDLKTDGEGQKGFQKFTVHRQGPQGSIREEIDSLHKLRKVEADSEQRYRNGEGEPMRFRGYSQNRSNIQVGSFGSAGQIGERAYDSGQPLRKSGKVGVKRHGTEEPRVPVARGGGYTALKD